MRSTHRFKSGGGYTPAWYDARAARGGSSSLANTVKLIHARESAHKSESPRKSESMSARKNEDESAHEIEESNAAFKFDSEAKYHPGPQHAAASDVGDLKEGRVQVQSDDPQKFFEATYPNIFEQYLLPLVSSDERIQTWRSTPMQFWQNQLNFAIWWSFSGGPFVCCRWLFAVFLSLPRVLPNTPYTERDTGPTTLR